MSSEPAASTPGIAVNDDAADPALRRCAEDLAARLALPLRPSGDTGFDYQLIYTGTAENYRLGLHRMGQRMLPLVVDFAGGTFGHRRRQHLRGELVAKAVGYKGQPLSIIDCTAGLGRDAAILALVGNTVTAIEQNPVVHALLEDSVRRARGSADAELTAALRENLTLVHADAVAYLASVKQPPDVIYLDPMFPARQKSALVKKEMRLLADITPHDGPADLRLLHAAIAAGPHRLVIKRPAHGPPLDPSVKYLSFEGEASRYDVLFPRV